GGKRTWFRAAARREPQGRTGGLVDCPTATAVAGSGPGATHRPSARPPDALRQPHRAQPHCTHTKQPDCRTVPAPQSGQGGGAGEGVASVFVRVIIGNMSGPTCLRQEAGAVSLSRWKTSG